MLLLLAVVAADPSLVPAPPGLEWLTPQLVDWLEHLPLLGHYVVLAFQYLGFVAAVFSALTVAWTAFLQAARAFAWAVGLEPLAAKILRLHDLVQPYLAYFSIFNVPPRGK